MPQIGFALELKKLSETGVFEGLASTYGNVDETGDVVLPGAFTKTLSASKDRPLLWQHRDPIGMVELSDSPAGLFVKGKLTLAVRQAVEAYALMKDGAVKGLSIGFETIRSDFKGAVRQLQELKLWEVSLVTMAANQQAVVTSVKAADLSRLSQEIEEFRRGILAAMR